MESKALNFLINKPGLNLIEKFINKAKAAQITPAVIDKVNVFNEFIRNL